MENASAGPAELRAWAIANRAQMLQRASQGRYEEVADGAFQFVDQVLDAMPASLEGVEDGEIPDLIGNIAFLADAAFAAVAAGRLEDATRILRGIGEARDILWGAADRIAAIGIQYCKDGRPSLDGECLQKPPCPSGS